MENLDPIDTAIMALLGQDGRLSNREIGRRLEISEATARTRVQKLQKAGVLKFVLLIDSNVSRKLAGAYIGVCVKPALSREVAAAIADLPGCFFVAFSLGRFNLMAYFSLAGRDELYAVTREQLETIPGVIEISVREVLQVIKHPFQISTSPED
jgi:DNA-binding Lrp family transcriptional regulator